MRQYMRASPGVIFVEATHRDVGPAWYEQQDSEASTQAKPNRMTLKEYQTKVVNQKKKTPSNIQTKGLRSFEKDSQGISPATRISLDMID